MSPSNRRTFGFQWDGAEAELKVRKDRIVVAPRATTGVSRQNKNSRAAHNAWGGKNMVEQCKFDSRVTAFAAGEKAFAERGCRASLKQGVSKPQMQSPLLELLNGGGQQVLGGREVVGGNDVQVAQDHNMVLTFSIQTDEGFHVLP